MEIMRPSSPMLYRPSAMVAMAGSSDHPPYVDGGITGISPTQYHLFGEPDKVRARVARAPTTLCALRSVAMHRRSSLPLEPPSSSRHCFVFWCASCHTAGALAVHRHCVCLLGFAPQVAAMRADPI